MISVIVPVPVQIGSTSTRVPAVPNHLQARSTRDETQHSRPA